MRRLPPPRWGAARGGGGGAAGAAGAGGGRAAAALPWAAALAGPAAPAAAQVAEPFSRLDVSAAGAVNVNRERLHQRWTPSEGAMLRVATPFYLGSIAVSAQLTPFSPRAPELPRFDALAVTLDWSVERNLLARVRASAGIQAGNMRFGLVDPHTQKVRGESELLLGARAGLSTRLVGGLGVMAAATHQRILTHVPIELTFVAVGLSYSFDTPGWFRDFLR